MAEAPQPRSRVPWLACLVLLALPLLLFADSFGKGRHFLPFDLAEFPPLSTKLSPEQLAVLQQGTNYDATEPAIWFLPELELTRQSVARDQYPHWNPLVRGGAPLTAHGHIGHFNPLHWPAFLFADPVDGLLWLSSVVLALAGLVMFGLLRELDSHIHREVRKLYSDAELPSFTHRQIGDDRMELVYTSRRSLADFALGLIEGCIAYFNEAIDVERVDLPEDEHGAHARFTLTRRVHAVA